MNTKYQNTESPHLAVDKNSYARARSLPYRRTYFWAVLWSAINYLAIIATITVASIFIIEPTRQTMVILVGSMIASTLTWIIAFFRRRATQCPLCKGTPLVSSGALVHRKATRIFPFNHGASAVISILAVQKFRCMYCATQYDLLKPRDSNRNAVRQQPVMVADHHVSRQKTEF
jgi:hypothetical protein